LDISLVLKNSTNLSNETSMIVSDIYSARGIISKATERSKLGFTTGLIYLCANPYTDSSFSILSSQ